MTLGLDWNEDLPYTDPRNGEIAMERAPDRVRYVLERPLLDAPGTTWRYCGGATALLAALLRASGDRLYFNLTNFMLWYSIYIEDVLEGELPEVGLAREAGTAVTPGEVRAA